MNSLDELFKKKLEDHAVAPSVAAWSKVEANLTKKKKVIDWVRIAAGLLLVSFAVGTFQLFITKNTSQLASADEKSVDQPKVTVLSENKKLSVEENNATNNKALKPTKPIIVKVKPIAPKPLEVADDTPPIEPIVATLEPMQTEASQATAANVSSVEKPIVIEFVLSPIDELETSVANAENTKPKTRLQKVVDFARDAKNGESNLGLRQAKDDLFALNFKKDKSKNFKN